MGSVCCLAQAGSLEMANVSIDKYCNRFTFDVHSTSHHLQSQTSIEDQVTAFGCVPGRLIRKKPNQQLSKVDQVSTDISQVVGISITRMIIVLQNLTQINKLIWGQVS